MLTFNTTLVLNFDPTDQPMKKYELQGTPKTPAVLFDPEQGQLTFTGRSVHENSDKFYTPIFELLQEYAASPADETMVRFELEYFNTSSAKYILDLIKKLEEMKLSGNSVKVEWIFEEGDLDMEEAGQDYNDLVDLDLEVVQK